MSEKIFKDLKKYIRETVKRKRLYDPSCEYVEFSMVLNSNNFNLTLKPPEILKIRVKDKIVSTVIDGNELTFNEDENVKIK